MMIHRSSALFWMLLAAAVLYYVKEHGDPRLWTFDQWNDAALAAVVWGIGKLQSSPLKGKDE
jgi:hypothetical protein